jgi:uncharacterized membrane protein
MSEISRTLLAKAGEQHVLPRDAMSAALHLAGLRPNGSDWRDFGIRALRFGGVLSLASGLIFLVAFNWQNLGVYQRFATVELPLLAAVVFAFVSGVEQLSGKLALSFAVMLTGALLALFGQTYQTGADVYELFVAWALLALPWVLACRYAPCWALWLILVNAAIGLYAGLKFSLPFLLNLLLYVTIILLSQWPALGLKDRWLRRAVIAVAMAYGTFAIIARIASERASSVYDVPLFLAASLGLAVYAYRQKDDLFNFAVLALAWVAVTTTLLARALMEDRAGIGALFILGMYLIGASTAAVKGISYIGRQWKTEEAQ